MTMLKIKLVGSDLTFTFVRQRDDGSEIRHEYKDVTNSSFDRALYLRDAYPCTELSSTTGNYFLYISSYSSN